MEKNGEKDFTLTIGGYPDGWSSFMILVQEMRLNGLMVTIPSITMLSVKLSVAMIWLS